MGDLVQVTSMYCQAYMSDRFELYKRLTRVWELWDVKQLHGPAVNSEVPKPKNKGSWIRCQTYTNDCFGLLKRRTRIRELLEA